MSTQAKIQRKISPLFIHHAFVMSYTNANIHECVTKLAHTHQKTQSVNIDQTDRALTLLSSGRTFTHIRRQTEEPAGFHVRTHTIKAMHTDTPQSDERDQNMHEGVNNKTTEQSLRNDCIQFVDYKMLIF